MAKNLLVALDIGTSGCRAIAVREDGSVAAQHYLPLAPNRPSPGKSEYQATELIKAAKNSLHAVLDKIGPQNAAAIAMASQRSTVVVWDKSSGESVGPVLSWEDGRALSQATQAPITQTQLHLKTGLYKTPFFSAPKIAWTLQNFPEAASLAAQKRLLAAPVASYIIWHLTGGKTFATDYSLAQRTLLFDVEQFAWAEPLAKLFGVPGDVLPDLKPSAADYGAYTYQGVSIPIVACVGDQQAATVYFGLDYQKSLINYGTGAFWLYHTGDKPAFFPGLLTSVGASSQPKKCTYLLEGPVNSAGSALLWLKAQGIMFDDAEMDTLCTSAAKPVWFLPAFGGMGAPYWDFETPTAVEGLSPLTRKADWVAGVTRGIAFLLTDISDYLKTNGLAVKGPVQVSGGLSRSTYLTSFQADLLQLPLEVTHQPDATALGAALLAADYIGQKYTLPLQYTPVSPRMSAHDSQVLHAAWQRFLTRVRRPRKLNLQQ